MLRITSIAIGLLSVVSMTSGAQALPNETFRPNAQPAVIRAEDLANYRGTGYNRPAVVPIRRQVLPVVPFRAEVRRHHRRVHVRRHRAENTYQYRKYHRNHHGVMRRYY
jgi:hypothetical protein